MARKQGDNAVSAGPASRSSSSRAFAVSAEDATAKSDNVPVLTSIDDVVSLVLSAQTDATGVASPTAHYTLHSALNKLYHQSKGNGVRILGGQLQGSIDPLAMLSPSDSTLGYTFVLAARASHASTQDEAAVLMPFVASYAQSMSAEQLNGAGEIVTLLARGIVNVAQIFNDLVWANPFLLRLLDNFRRAQGGLNNLTTLHPIVLYHMLRTAHYETAVDWIVQHDIVSADRNFSPLAYTDVLEYFYYGGLASSMLHDYERASSMFEQCVCSPAQHVSAIQIDAYKKLILVQLLWQGKVSPLPHYASQAVKRAIRGRITNLEAYQTLSSVYCDTKNLNFRHAKAKQKHQDAHITADQALQSVIEAEHTTFARDLNVGLVHRLARSFLQRRLQWLSAMFTCITVGAVTEIVNVGLSSSIDDASRAALYAHIVESIGRAHEAGWLQATIVGADGNVVTAGVTSTNLQDAVVRFSKTEEDHVRLAAAQELMAVMKESRRWNEAVYEKERSIARSEAFLAKISAPSRDNFASLNVDDADDAFD